MGEIVDYGVRIEFQNRGSPHAHCVIWIKDAPKYYEVNDDSDVCAFIDQYISHAIPSEEGKLKELVQLLQQHKHAFPLLQKAQLLYACVHGVIKSISPTKKGRKSDFFEGKCFNSESSTSRFIGFMASCLSNWMLCRE